MKKYLLIVFGFIFLGLGTLGLFLPVLPTTPFWLLTAGCFLRASKPLYDRAMAHPVFGKVVRDYMEKRGVSRRVKIVSISTLWATIVLSACLVDQWWVRILLLCVAIGVTIHLLCLKTVE